MKTSPRGNSSFYIVPPIVKDKRSSRVRLSGDVEKIAQGKAISMKSPRGYFVLGFLAASAIWLIGLAILNGELLRTFMHFSGN